jgi:hypothetical protein
VVDQFSLVQSSPRHKGLYRLYRFFMPRFSAHENLEAVLDRGGLLCVKGKCERAPFLAPFP